MSRVIYIMGVSGSGKTHIGKRLAQALQLPYFDADDFHPIENIQKMKSGTPLTDDDRSQWLATLHDLAHRHIEQGCVISCSALKQQYRDILALSVDERVLWVYLKGTYEVIYQRMKNRKGHFMKPDMLASQFKTLEEPQDALEIDTTAAPEVIIEKIKKAIV